MNASSHFPPSLHWSAQQLADAVPLRLFEQVDLALVDFGAHADAGRAANTANTTAAVPRRSVRQGYLRSVALPIRFHIHN